MIKETARLLLFLCRVLSAAEEQWAVSRHGLNVWLRIPYSHYRSRGVYVRHSLLL